MREKNEHAARERIVRALLTVRLLAAMAEPIAGCTLVSGDPGASENREGGAEACPPGPRCELFWLVAALIEYLKGKPGVKIARPSHFGAH